MLTSQWVILPGCRKLRKKKSQTQHISILLQWNGNFWRRRKNSHRNETDNPFFLFPVMENYHLHYIRFAFTQITQQEQILAKYFCSIGKVTNTFISNLVKWMLSLLMARGFGINLFIKSLPTHITLWFCVLPDLVSETVFFFLHSACRNSNLKGCLKRSKEKINWA